MPGSCSLRHILNILQGKQAFREGMVKTEKWRSCDINYSINGILIAVYHIMSWPSETFQTLTEWKVSEVLTELIVLGSDLCFLKLKCSQNRERKDILCIYTVYIYTQSTDTQNDLHAFCWWRKSKHLSPLASLSVYLKAVKTTGKCCLLDLLECLWAPDSAAAWQQYDSYTVY